jgi:hypothetical protein
MGRGGTRNVTPLWRAHREWSQAALGVIESDVAAWLDRRTPRVDDTLTARTTCEDPCWEFSSFTVATGPKFC